jgi:hypothetical protein
MPTHAHTRVLIRRTYTDQVQVYFQQSPPKPELIIDMSHTRQSRPSQWTPTRARTRAPSTTHTLCTDTTSCRTYDKLDLVNGLQRELEHAHH